jgi:enamine deaminase RidA (YjgF/YER057c/UK114 family)
VERQRVTSGGAYEAVFGYCRAVRVGNNVYVAGTAPAMPDDTDPPSDSYGQARRCFEIIGAALSEAGATFADVVRTRMYITPEADFDEVGRAHGEIFQDVRPVNTTVIIAGLVDPRWHLEIDVDAVVD